MTREVCDVGADQLLPAFGGDRVAIYVVRERRMRLLVQRGYRESFLDRGSRAHVGACIPSVGGWAP
ncbi:hypothetical protein QF035_010717 [Streptomyces umbrinus]|uniref:Uncharacterized protein n=1 Tax=Streptomyces umbrinus TaxID=67370 RepID=A0ABU0TBK7_9ACTN|nr:hypothetical protein [Streptomyces umbrinus]MDQ1033135.1 hypothetical protein [Streptomyces umbrinus]